MTRDIHRSRPLPSCTYRRLPAEPTLPTYRRVRVWFGEHVIADYTAEPAKAVRYQKAMTRRFYGLRVTIEPINPVVNQDAANP